MKQITITVPDNCELKKEGNIYTIVEKEKKLTYDDVADKIFPNGKYHYFIGASSDITEIGNLPSNYKLQNNCTSKKQAQKLLAINKLMNVAKYLNGDWQPDWSNHDKLKWFIDAHVNHYIDSDDVDTVSIYGSISHKLMSICFKSRELAQQAIEILGEETIRLALCADY